MKKIRFYLRWISLGALWFFALVLVGWTLWEKDGFWDYRALQGRKVAVLEEKAMLQAKNRELSRQVGRLRDDYEYLEAVAREQLGMIPLHAQIYLLGDRE